MATCISNVFSLKKLLIYISLDVIPNGPIDNDYNASGNGLRIKRRQAITSRDDDSHIRRHMESMNYIDYKYECHARSNNV